MSHRTAKITAFVMVIAMMVSTLFFTSCGKQKKTDMKTDEEATTLQQEGTENNSGTKNAEEESSKQELQTMENTLTKEDVVKYSNAVVTWGPGIQTCPDGRPSAPVAFQKKYQALNAEFIRENEKVIYLTFDEGYENGHTGSILDTLKEKSVSAVFFVTMPYAKEQTELMNRMIEEGHVIGNHSISHPSAGMPSLTVEEQMQECNGLNTYIKETYNYDVYLFRPPAGIFSEQSLCVTASLGLKTVLWSFAYADWDPEHQPSKEDAINKMEGRLHNGAIYLLHATSQTNTDVLGEFIDYAKEKGYEFKKFEN